MAIHATATPDDELDDALAPVAQTQADGADLIDFAQLFEWMPVAIAVFDANEKLVLCNKIFRSNQGSKIGPHIVPGLSFADLVDLHVRFDTYPKTAGDANAWRAERIAAFRNADSVRVDDWRHIGWYQVDGRRLPNGYRITVGTDISEVKDGAEQLELLRQRLTDYVNVASDWFWETDARHRFTFMSDRLTATTGLQPSAYIGRDRRTLALQSDDKQAWAAHLNVLQAHGAFRDFRYSVHTDDGHLVHVSVSGQPVFDARERFAGYRGTGINVTREVEAQRASDRFLAAIESVSDGYSLWDADDKLIVCNHRWVEITGPTSTVPIVPGLNYETHLRDNVRNGAFPAASPDPEAWIRERVRLHRNSNSERTFELQRENGRWLSIQERATPEGGVLQILSDISDLKQREIALRQSEERFKGFAESAADWFWELDQDFRITFLSARYEQLTGKKINTLIGSEFSGLASSQDADQGAINSAIRILRNRDVLHEHEIHASNDDTPAAVHSLSGRAVRDTDGVITGYRGTGRDVTQARLLSIQLAHQASHDELTGLVNRRGFEQRLARALESAQNARGRYALCYLDLDRFKVVNDSCGHAAGDELLRQLAGVLKDKVRGRDTVARFGGDEFALLLENCTLDEARPIADGLRAAVEAFDFAWQDKQFRIGASIGLVLLRPESSIAELMRAADSACFMAKNQGRNRVHVYESDDQEQSRRERELDWVSRINEALAEDRFVLYGQLIRASSRVQKVAAEHYEILLRLRDKNDNIVGPGAFLPAAERFGLATRVDRWVVQRAFDLLEGSPDLIASDGFLSINLSGQSLGDTDFCAYVVHQLRTRAVRGANICFEITETAAIADLSAAQTFMHETAALDCRFALDDFGTGLSSFAYLRDLPVDFVKIDGAFIKNIETDPIQMAMVRSIHEIASILGKQTIAEFVPNEATARLLAGIGLDYVQGFGIAEPAPLLQLLGR